MLLLEPLPPKREWNAPVRRLTGSMPNVEIGRRSGGA